MSVASEHRRSLTRPEPGRQSAHQPRGSVSSVVSASAANLWRLDRELVGLLARVATLELDDRLVLIHWVLLAGCDGSLQDAAAQRPRRCRTSGTLQIARPSVGQSADPADSVLPARTSVRA